MKSNKRMYIKIIDILEKSPRSRKELIDEYILSLGLTREQLADRRTGGRANVERSKIGPVINEMKARGMITKSPEGIYYAADQKPIVIRNGRCESEIIKMLASKEMTRSDIRRELVKIFGTEKTVTEKDDNKLFSYMGEALRVLVREGVLVQNGNSYALAGKTVAKIDDINGMLELRNIFLSRLHKKGGEFFENYFMTLLGKYVSLFGKTVVTNTTTGGSADGGIDGIMETVDPLGFREKVMVQMKNRSDTTIETTVRGFYGAVCAAQGSRGIFATTSDFHPAADRFLKSIDNCVGVDGDMIFKMAMQTHYGIRKSGTEYTVDDHII
ncbi:MAG: hypothetical protein E7617_08235 [Ruminococcaceae bacterium]|nr:hypothetical protein [Oscillospiraceae bacterium]